ncbi:MAG TPA: CbiX/SirB N-terminal domain-containing protein [Methylophaga sp.]|nr:CbiX/SirB N-terminal domain-containing protein [Methylophaga sp.]
MNMHDSKKALLLVAHGSRRAASNQEVVRLAGQLQVDLKTDFAVVKAAFLELAEPSIPDGIESCVKAGADSVVVLPYFLNTGRHVAEDIPAEIDKARQQLPSLSIKLQNHIGALPEMHSLLLKAATNNQ